MKILLKLFLVLILLSVPGLCRAMPPGTILYRTSGDGKMFGYSRDPLIYSEKGIVKNIYSGHAAIYIGKENGEDYIVEAMAGGIVKNPAKYFVNRADGETFLGARMPTAVTALQQARVVALAKSLVGMNLGYDFDFHAQKGPGDEQWTCVGLTEKLYESANVVNPNNLGALEYDPAYYAVDITPDGFDDQSVVNSAGDCFSQTQEFSKIARRTDILVPAPELVGYDVGLEHEGDRYIFLPYTQFLQPSLAPVAADVEIYSSFSRAEINGPLNLEALALRWSLINNPLSSLKAIGTVIKDAVVKVAEKTKEIAQNLSQKFFNSDSETSLTLVDDDLSKTIAAAASSTNKVTVVKKVAAVKTTKAPAKTSSKIAAKSGAKSLSVEVSTGKTASVKVNTGKNAGIEVSAGQTASVKISATKSGTSKTAKATTTAKTATAKTNPTYYSPAASAVSPASTQGGGSGGSSSSSGSSSSGNSAATAASYPKLASINKIYSTGDNDWVEIINITDHDFDLAAAGYRLEKAKSAEDPSILIRLGDPDDAIYPGGTIIKAHGTYLIAGSGANDYYKQKADALVTREGFGWPGSGYTLYLGTGAISSSADPDIIDAVGFGQDATFFLGSGPAPEIKDNYILRRASSSADNAVDFNLILSDDPSLVLNTESDDPSLATSTPETATSTTEIATSTDPDISETASSTESAADGLLALIRKIYSTGNNDWIELFNPTDNDFDLATANYRLEKAVSVQDPSILMRFGDDNDGFYPGGTVIRAHDDYLIVRDEVDNYYLNQADAIATRTDFSWGGNGYSFYLGKGAVSSGVDADIIDLVGFGPDAYYYEGAGPAPEIPDAYILNRLANTHNNSTDFNLIASDDPNIENPEPEFNSDLFSPPVPTISAGLTDVWHFNECYGEGTWAVGKWDCARQFGINGQVPLKISLDPAIDMNDGFSLSFYYKRWENVPRAQAVLSNAEGAIFSIKTDAGMLEIEGLPNSEFRYYQGIPDDYQWHKLTLVINQAADYWEIYIDSSLVVRENFLARLPIMTDLEIKSVTIAVLVDELALWDRALAASEIAADYRADAPYSPMPERSPQEAAELLHFWSFEEDSGDEASDSVGQAVINLDAGAWVGRVHDNYAIKTKVGQAYTAVFPDFPETKDLSLAFWWRDSSDPNNGRADIYLTGGTNNEKNLFAILADNFRLDYWFNNNYSILAEGFDKAIPGGSNWHYLTYVYDSYRYKLNFYVDGEEKASTSLIWMPDGEEITGLKIATGGNEAEIDDLGIWKGALSPRQVKEIYTNNK